MNLSDIVKGNKELILVLTTLLPIVWSATGFLQDTTKTSKRERFEMYQSIITDISKGGRDGQSGSQRALIYELRFFDQYKDLTCRELKIMRLALSDFPLTMNEIELTWKYLKCKNS